MQIFSVILRKAELCVLFRLEQQIPRELYRHDNELQRASVISYEELSGDRRPLFQ